MDTTTILICCIVAIIIAIVLVSYIQNRRKLIATGIKVDGIVFEMTNEGGIGNEATYYPVIRFLTIEKEWITQRYNLSGIASPYKEGDNVTVFYDPADPTNFVIKKR